MNRLTGLDLLRRSGEDLQRYVREIPAERLHWHEEGEWSAHETLGHICETEREVFLLRAKRLTAEHNPSLKNFDGEAWHAQHYDPQRPVAELLADFAEARREMIAAIEVEPDWSRDGFHEGWQKRYGIALLAEYTIHHTWEHLNQIANTQIAYELAQQF